MKDNTSRENFAGRFAVIMAMAGSAIGLGNIWRFPYIAGEMGGGVFVAVYIAATILFSLPLAMTEVLVGRRSRHSAANALYVLSGKKKMWRVLSVSMVLCPLIILSYYSVVGGWSLHFLSQAVTFGFDNDPDAVSGFFGKFITNTYAPVAAHLIFLGLTALVVSGGVKSGIERFNKFTVPVLFVMIVFILCYSLFLPGAEKGVDYLIKFDTASFDIKILAYALGQSFYSLSLGMGALITYGSYVKKQDNILTSGITVAFSDLSFAILAAFAIMPAVFAAGLEPGAGPGLIFQTIPYIFSTMSQSMPFISGVVAIVFFLSIVAAALTSSVSLLEVGVAYLVENTKLSRRKATLILFVILGVAGTLCSLGFGPLKDVQLGGKGIFDIMDWFCSNVLLLFVCLITVIYVGWFLKKEDFADEFSSGGRYPVNVKVASVLFFVIKYVAPIGILAIFVTNFIL